MKPLFSFSPSPFFFSANGTEKRLSAPPLNLPSLGVLDKEAEKNVFSSPYLTHTFLLNNKEPLHPFAVLSWIYQCILGWPPPPPFPESPLLLFSSTNARLQSTSSLLSFWSLLLSQDCLPSSRSLPELFAVYSFFYTTLTDLNSSLSPPPIRITPRTPNSSTHHE